MSKKFPPNLLTFGAGKFSLGKNISTFEEYISLPVVLIIVSYKWSKLTMQYYAVCSILCSAVYYAVQCIVICNPDYVTYTNVII